MDIVLVKHRAMSYALLAAIFVGCGQQRKTHDQIASEKYWGSTRFSAAEKDIVFLNFYSRITDDVASIGYTVPSAAMKDRPKHELIEESCRMARRDYLDAYRSGTIMSQFREYFPKYVIVSLREFSEPANCVVLLEFSMLFEDDLKILESQLIYDFDGRSNREIVENWKSSGEWKTRLEEIE